MSDAANWKSDLLEKIDAVWRNWLTAVNRVDDARINEPGVAGYWSVQDLTAHLAYWESVVLEHIERDRLGLGPRSIDVDAINQRIYHENHDRDFALVRADLFRAHFATMSALSALVEKPSTRLAGKIGDETWDHYPEHTQQVIDWLNGPKDKRDMTPAQISAKYALAVANGMELFERIPEELRLEPGLCGVWSARDLLGHLAFWDGYRLSRIDAEMAGNPIPTIDDSPPYDRTNAEQAALRENWTWEQVLDEATGIHDRLVDVLLVQSQLDQSSAGNHWDLHRADLQAWIERQG